LSDSTIYSEKISGDRIKGLDPLHKVPSKLLQNFHRKVRLRESKAFSKSISTRILGPLFLFAHSQVSSIVRIPSDIDLPLINKFWL